MSMRGEFIVVLKHLRQTLSALTRVTPTRARNLSKRKPENCA